MANKIKLGRATKTRIEDIKATLEPYELVYSMDTNELGVKNGDGTITYIGKTMELEWSNILNKPTFSTVATSGAYADLTGKPDLDLKLDKNFSALPAQTNPLLTDVLVLNRGTTVQKVTLGNLLAQIDSEIFIVVATLPATGVVNKIYLVPKTTPEGQDVYDEFIWVNSAWENLGTIALDLSNYYNKTEVDTLLNGKLDKVTSSTSLAQVYAKGAGGTQAMINISNQVGPNYAVQRKSDNQIAVPLIPNSNNDAISKEYADKFDKIFWVTYGTTTYSEIQTALTDEKLPIAIKDGYYYTYVFTPAPTTGSYFQNMWLGVNKHIYVTEANVWNTRDISLELGSNKTNTLSSASTTTQYPNAKIVYDTLDNKVDKIVGKGLSTEDYTTTEKNKLAGIASGAEVNVQSDWNITDTANDAFIKNKPAIKTVATTGDYNDLTNKPDLTLKLDKNFTALPNQASPLLTDVLAINRGTVAQKTTLGSLLAQVDSEIFIVVATLPATGVVNKIYLVPKGTPEAQNTYDEFIWVNSAWENLGTIALDLSNHYNKTEVNGLLSAKVDKNNAITAGTHPKITYDAKGLVTGGSSLVAGDIPNLDAGKITSGTFVDERIPNLNASKINAGTFDVARIPNLAPSKITQDANNRFVTDTEKATWNNKQNALTAGDGISISGNVISADGGLNVETWNTATKTLALSDANKLFVCAHTNNQTLTIPTNSSVSFPIGTIITFLSASAFYKVTFSGASGVTLWSMDGLVELATQFAMASLIKTDTNTWQLVGALE